MKKYIYLSRKVVDLYQGNMPNFGPNPTVCTCRKRYNLSNQVFIRQGQYVYHCDWQNLHHYVKPQDADKILALLRR